MITKMATPLSNYLGRIPANDLDQPIDYKNTNSMGAYIPKDLGLIADAMPEWEGTATTALGLGDADVAQIREKHPGKPRLIRREVLKLWKSRRGAARSTPRELITAFHEAKLYDYCDIVCTVLGSATSSPDHEILPPAAKKVKAETSLSARAPSEMVTIDSGEIIDDTDTAPNEAKALSSDLENNPFHWCSFIGQQEVSVQPSATASNEAYSAVFPRGVLLWKKQQITVAFTNKTIGLLDDWDRDVEYIIELANRWHKQQKEPNYNIIPEFIAHGSQSVRGADIIVELNVNGRNESLPGNAGKAGSTKPTMWLDLSGKDDNYNEHLVVHEFGHALGLGHEHQRSDFRACVIPFLDETKMRESLGDRYKDWERDDELDVENATAHDPKSVMHYWFEKEWLKHGYDNRKKIQDHFDAQILSEKMKNALLAVHNCKWETLPTKPSAKDLTFVNGMYGKIKPED